MINKTFTYKGFNNIDDAFEYARKAERNGATYIEIMITSPRFKYLDFPIIVQHNARRWIK